MEKPLTSVRRESMDLAGLLEEHGDHLLRLCTLYLGDRSQAEDAVQDTFLRALRAWPGFRGDCAVETWLVRIAINVCKRQLRSPWRLLRAPQESLDSLRMEGPEPPDDTLVRALQLCAEEPERLLLVTKWLYPDVAKQYGTNWKAVERDIRTVGRVIWNSNRPLLETLARRELSQKPCTAQLLAILHASLLPSGSSTDEE